MPLDFADWWVETPITNSAGDVLRMHLPARDERINLQCRHGSFGALDWARVAEAVAVLRRTRQGVDALY